MIKTQIRTKTSASYLLIDYSRLLSNQDYLLCFDFVNFQEINHFLDFSSPCFVIKRLSALETSGVVAIHCIKSILYSGNNRRSIQHNEGAAESIFQAFAGKTKKDYHVPGWGVRRTISTGNRFVFFYEKLNF